MLRECLIGADRPYPSFRINTVMFAPVLSGWAEIGNVAVPGHTLATLAVRKVLYGCTFSAHACSMRYCLVSDRDWRRTTLAVGTMCYLNEPWR